VGWPGHPRIHLKLDTEHPIYAAHRQKIVWIDDGLAFIGGIDLTVGRWDTSVCDIVRRRWLAATNQQLEPAASGGDPWPARLEPDFRKIDVALSRTAPPWRGVADVREGLACTKALLRATERSIFIEQQYLTGRSYGRILARSLRKRPVAASKGCTG